MALAYLGIERSQRQLADLLEVEPLIGAPARHIGLLASRSIAVTLESGTMEVIDHWLAENTPVIAFVQAGELAYWRGESFQHAVIVTGLADSMVWLLDPDAGSEPIATPKVEDTPEIVLRFRSPRLLSTQ